MPTRCFLSAKIHGASITTASPDYEGSLSIDPDLMQAVGILPFERIDVYNMDNGERLTTYAIPGAPGQIGLNGAAAHKGSVGQRVIVAAYCWLDADEAPGHKARVIIADKHNKPVRHITCEVSPPDDH
ncbi:MAG: aspartate 1-decarboxylase [Desulfovibrionaceae bacterium]